jgi:hypothetical protein
LRIVAESGNDAVEIDDERTDGRQGILSIGGAIGGETDRHHGQQNDDWIHAWRILS